MSFFDNALCMINPLCSVNRDEFTGTSIIDKDLRREVMVSVLVTFLLIILFQILPVMLIAVNCNPKSPVTYGIIAFLFPGVYLFQHAVRKYLVRERGYCGN